MVVAGPGSSGVAAIEAACAAAGVAVTPGQVATLTAYMDLLERWNATYNLSAVRDRDAALSRHIADCVSVVPAVTRQTRAGASVLDVGSGGGLPGVVLAVLLPDRSVTCIDTVGKKAAFLRQVAGTLRLPNLLAVHGRAEQWRSPPFDLVVSRAFASLADFVRWTGHLLAPNGVWMAMKGHVPDDEIAALAARTDAEVFHVEHLSVPSLDARRCLVWMKPAP